jgi:class 3 adenylate cyclase
MQDAIEKENTNRSASEPMRLRIGIHIGRSLQRNRWFADSPLEESGFELSVPP